MTDQPGQYTKASLAQEIFFSAITFVALRPVPELIAKFDDTIATPSVLGQAYFYVCVLISITLSLIFFKSNGTTSLSPFGSTIKCWPIGFFTLVAFSSLAWTSNLSLTLHSCVFLFMDIALASTMITRFGSAFSLKIVAFASMLALSFSIVFLFLRPDLGIHTALMGADSTVIGKWRGLFPHKNLLAMCAAVLFVILSCSRRGPFVSLPIQIIGIATSILILIEAGSAGVNVAVIFTLGFQYLLNFSPRTRRFLFVVVVVLAPLAYLLLPVLADVFFDLLGRDSTLTGRTLIWSLAMQFIASTWPLGAGYGNGDALSDYIFHWIGSSDLPAHNAILQAAAETGVFGLMSIAFFLFYFLRRVFTDEMTMNETEKCALCVLFLWIFSSISESQSYLPNTSYFVAGTIAFFIIFFEPTPDPASRHRKRTIDRDQPFASC